MRARPAFPHRDTVWVTYGKSVQIGGVCVDWGVVTTVWNCQTRERETITLCSDCFWYRLDQGEDADLMETML